MAKEDEQVTEQAPPKAKKKSKKHKRGSTTVPVDERSKTYGKQKDLFPELTALPEFANYNPDDDDNSLTSAATRYDTKEDQDVAVFLALAGRMNIDSLLFILQGHAREMNLPSSEFLLPEKRKEAELKAKKHFRWKEDDNGDVFREVFEIVPMKEEELWFDDDFSQRILMSAIRDVRYYQANKPEFIEAVKSLATEQDGDQTEAFMKTLINDKHARGLEVHIVGYIEEIRRDFVNAVLDEQDDCEDAGEDYFTTAKRMRKAALQYTIQAQEFAYKLAKCDHIVALKASLSKWDKPKSSKKKAVDRVTRHGSSSKKAVQAS